jgi:DNA gyrase subunit A
VTDPIDHAPRDIAPVTIEDEMRRSYLDYAMSVIVARALPDVRDGLKPVHRRILYAMKESGYDWNRPYRKSARVVGEVMGKYHPHGDAPIYEAMVRMAQDFSMRLTLIDGQGNFGSMDGDPPAAMRYTEARLDKSAAAMLHDIDRDTVDFHPNYDDSLHEPGVLPAQFPNLLVNGASGIAVGMATNIPTHNFGEVIDACCAYIDNPNIDHEALMAIVPGPDFPTGGIVMASPADLREAYRTGRGSVVVRGKLTVEALRKDREAIIITEIPYQVNKQRLVERIAELVREKIIDGVGDLRDESDRDGVRIVIELKREAIADIVLNQLYRYTPLQTSFGLNMLALNRGRPEVMGLRAMIAAFIAFREEVITRRTRFELRKARERLRMVVGLLIAVANIDEVIKIIRGSRDPVIARERLMATVWPAGDIAPLLERIGDTSSRAEDGTQRLSEEQAKAILDLRLQRLTGLEMEKLAAEGGQLREEIGRLLTILSSRDTLYGMMRAELVKMRAEFADPRRTQIEQGIAEQNVEDLIQPEDMVVTVTHAGYVKRVPLTAYRAQRRGGKGRAGMATREQDFLTQVFVANTHQPVLFFTASGMVYQLKVWMLPEGTPQSRGKPLVTLIEALRNAAGDSGKVATIMPLPQDEGIWANLTVMFATSAGDIRRNALSDFVNVKANGKIAMRLQEGERLIAVTPCRDDQEVLLATANGKSIRFAVDDVRVFSSRTSTGVRGIRLGKGDEVISMTVLRKAAISMEEREAYVRMASARRRALNGEPEPEEPAAEQVAGDAAEPPVAQITLSEERFAELARQEEFILTVTQRGYGKRTSAYAYRVTGRGGSGIANIDVTEKNGRVLNSFPVSEQDQIMLVTDAGQLIRLRVDEIRVAGRKTQGVVLFKVGEVEHVVSVTRLTEEDDSAGAEGK